MKEKDEKQPKQNNVIPFKKKRNIRQIIGLGCMLVVLICGILLVTLFPVERIRVKGNRHYTSEQIEKSVRKDWYVDNTLLMVLRNRILPQKSYPFIEHIKISLKDRNTLLVTVEEKELAGYVALTDGYVYIDTNGVAVEKSNRCLNDVPSVEGITFKTFSMKEKLPVKQERQFSIVLRILTAITETGMPIDRVMIEEDKQIVLYSENIRIQLGTSLNLDMKLANLPAILEGAEGLSGTMYMESYSEENRIVSFQKTKKAVKTT
ncbi:MAG: cell division protein FtsQ/DivIB [Lachnospiraceae bacterium]